MELAEQATNSNGNALQNNEKYIDSMSGKLQNLENVGKTAWIHILDSEALKSGIDVLSMLIELLDTLVSKAGLIGTIGLGAGLFTGTQNVGRSKCQTLCSKNANGNVRSLGYQSFALLSMRYIEINEA